MKAVAILRQEGGVWESFEIDRYGGKIGIGGTVHAIKFDNGMIWDTINGFRGRKNRFRVVPPARRSLVNEYR